MDKSEWIRSQALPNESASALASRLNTPELVDNPDSEVQIPRTITISDLLAECTDSEEFAACETQTYSLAVEAFNSGNRVDAINYFSVLIKGGIVGAESAQKIGALLAETAPDPSYKPQILQSPAQQAGFDVVTVDEVIEALKQ
jgi:hypothetical protein